MGSSWNRSARRPARRLHRIAMILIAVYAHSYWARSVLAQFLRRIAARAAICPDGSKCLYKALSGERNSGFDTIPKAMSALGIRLQAAMQLPEQKDQILELNWNLTPITRRRQLVSVINSNFRKIRVSILLIGCGPQTSPPFVIPAQAGIQDFCERSTLVAGAPPSRG